MPQFSLRALIVVTLLGGPVLAVLWWAINGIAHVPFLLVTYLLTAASISSSLEPQHQPPGAER